MQQILSSLVQTNGLVSAGAFANRLPPSTSTRAFSVTLNAPCRGSGDQAVWHHVCAQ